MAQHSCVACGLSRRAFSFWVALLSDTLLRVTEASSGRPGPPGTPSNAPRAPSRPQSWGLGRCPAAPAGAPGSPQVRWRVVGPHHGLCTAHQPQCTAHQAQCTAHQAQCTAHQPQCTAHQPQCTAHRHRTPGTVHTATAHQAQCTPPPHHQCHSLSGYIRKFKAAAVYLARWRDSCLFVHSIYPNSRF